MSDKTNRENGDPQRTGEEKELREDLERNDEESGEGKIRDRPGSENRRERRRANFIDLHGDEDGDPQTSERTYRKQHGGSDSSADSTPSTSSTSSTSQTTSTTSTGSNRR